jgi:hypothetical protein
VAADVGHGQYLVYDRQNYGATLIARALPAARVFSQELKIDKEFTKTLGTGASPDNVSVSVVQRATIIN